MNPIDLCLTQFLFSLTNMFWKWTVKMIIENRHILLSRMSKLSTETDRIDHCQDLAGQLSILTTKVDFFDVQQLCVCILFILKHVNGRVQF